MICDTLEHLARYNGLHPNLDTAIDYLLTHDLSALPNGRTEVDGDEVFINVMDAALHPDAGYHPEYHKLYADLQIDITGGDMMITIIVLVWASAIISSFLDNIPLVATLIPIITTMEATGMDVMPLWWAVSLGACIGGIGTLLYQLLSYGVTATTALWIAPYVLLGLCVGAVSARHGYACTKRQLVLLVVLGELGITALNTGSLYIDSLIYGYYSPVFVFGTLPLRLGICAAKAVVFSLLLPSLLPLVRRAVQPHAN